MLFSCTDNRFITVHYTVYGGKVLSSRGVVLFILYLETLLKRGVDNVMIK